MNTWIKTSGLAFALAVGLAGCDSANDGDGTTASNSAEAGNLAEVIAGESALSTTAGAFDSTGLNGVLEGAASYTVFAPNDAAYGALGTDGAAALGDNERGAIIAAILREHMVPGALSLEAIRDAISAKGGPVTMATFGAGELTFSMDGDSVLVQNSGGQSARISGAGIESSNGVVFPIDTVLVDPAALEGSQTED